MEHLHNSFHLPQHTPNDLIDAHLHELRVWTLDYFNWRISLIYTTPVRGQRCMRLFIYPNAASAVTRLYGTPVQQSRPGLTTTFFKPAPVLYSSPMAVELAAFTFHTTTTVRAVYTAMSASIPGYRLLGGDGYGHQGWVFHVIDILSRGGYLSAGAPQEFVQRLHACRAVSVLARDQIEWPMRNMFLLQSSNCAFE